MATKTRKAAQPEQWVSGRVFILAAAGAVIGLNDVWNFPYFVGQYGGGAFIIVYAVFLLFIGLPLIMSQVLIGRLGRASPIRAVRTLAQQNNSDSSWPVLGWLYTITGFLVLSYLSVIGGWTISYSVRAIVGAFNGLTADGINSVFTEYVQDPEKQLFWHTLFIVMTMIVVAHGVRGGLQPFVKVVMPLVFVLLGLLLGYAFASQEYERALIQLLYPDFSRLGVEGVLIAMGHAFFSLGLGFGIYAVYGSYLPDKSSIASVSLWVIILDLCVGLIIAIVVYTILFSANEPAAFGPVLLFQSIPLALDSLPLGTLVGSLFFIMLVLIVWLTAIGLVEPIMAWMVEYRNMTRFRAAIILGSIIWALGIVTILSFNYWKYSFDYFGVEKTLGFFDTLQVLTSNVLIPVAAIVTSLFTGWALDRLLTREGLSLRIPYSYKIWLWMVRIVIPLLLLVVLFAISESFK